MHIRSYFTFFCSHARKTASAVVVFQLPTLNEFLSQILKCMYVVWNILLVFGRGISKDQ